MKAIVKKKGFSAACNVANSILSRARGLMFSSLHWNEGLLFVFPEEEIVDIHMLFVFFPLDVVWLNKKGKIVQIKRNVKPFMPFIAGEKATYLLEMKAGNTSALRMGDTLDIINL